MSAGNTIAVIDYGMGNLRSVSKALEHVAGGKPVVVTVRSKHAGRDFMAGLKNIVGGELKGYTELLEESRQEAMQRMIEKARGLGANAIVGIRFSTSNIAQGASELFVYGTAVRVDAIAPKLANPFPAQG